MPSDSVKKKTSKVKDTVMRQPSLVWDKLTARERKETFAFAEGYKDFLNSGKTEREAVAAIEKHAKLSGFKEATASPSKMGFPLPLRPNSH